MRVPDSTIWRVSASYSAGEPSHQTIASGRVSSAISSTQATTDAGAPSGAVS
jgi:hypothetical protein